LSLDGAAQLLRVSLPRFAGNKEQEADASVPCDCQSGGRFMTEM